MKTIENLTLEELLMVNGGDSFMRNLGRGIGMIGAAIDNAIDGFISSQAIDCYRCKI